MIQLEENKSQIWFKILNADATPIDGSNEVWSVPAGDKRGQVQTSPGAPSKRFKLDGTWYDDPSHREVTWLVNNPSLLYQLNAGLKVYVAQIFGIPAFEEPGVIWVYQAELLRETTNMDLKPFGIYRAFEQKL